MRRRKSSTAFDSQTIHTRSRRENGLAFGELDIVSEFSLSYVSFLNAVG